MSDVSANSKRIAKNTVFLYTRMLFIMLIALYTSRIILATLGIEDYGIYNVIGGISTSLIFLSASLSNATQRYLNFEIGTNNNTQLSHIFNLSLLIYAIYAIIALLAVEFGGMWLIHHKLIIPESRIDAAIWVLHATSITLFATLLCSVFDSVLIARENMKIYAFVGIFDVVGKLVIVLLLYCGTFDKLKLYAVLMTLVVISSRLISTIYCLRKYPECTLKFYWNRNLFKDMFKFTGWNAIGTTVFILNDQGLNILLNIFFGPAINAARAIAVHVKSAVTGFTSNFLTAVRPQIIKSYAAGDIEYFLNLVFNSSRYSFFLLWIICLPIMIRSDQILTIWLKSVPDQTNEFVTWMLIFSLVNCVCDPIWQAMQAIGKLRRYILIGSIIYLTAFPLSALFFKLGKAPLIAFQILTVVRVAYLLAAVLILKHFVTFSIRTYVIRVFVPIIKVVLISAPVLFFINPLFGQSFIALIIVGITSVIVIALAIFLVGITHIERQLVLNKIYKRYDTKNNTPNM